MLDQLNRRSEVTKCVYEAKNAKLSGSHWAEQWIPAYQLIALNHTESGKCHRQQTHNQHSWCHQKEQIRNTLLWGESQDAKEGVMVREAVCNSVDKCVLQDASWLNPLQEVLFLLLGRSSLFNFLMFVSSFQWSPDFPCSFCWDSFACSFSDLVR